MTIRTRMDDEEYAQREVGRKGIALSGEKTYGEYRRPDKKCTGSWFRLRLGTPTTPAPPSGILPHAPSYAYLGAVLSGT